MPEAYKILGQAAPAATTETALYTVPASASTVGSSIMICNRGAAPATYRISVTTSGATSPKDYLFYDVMLNGNATDSATIGITLATGNIVRVYASTTDLSFNLFGTEIT